MTLFENIKNLCEEKGLNINKLEKLAGLAPRSMSKWEKTIPSVDKVAKVASVLSVSIEELIGLPAPENKNPAITTDDGKSRVIDFMETMDQLSPENLESLKAYVLFLQHQQTTQDESK